MKNKEKTKSFVHRHIGLRGAETQSMLNRLGFDTLQGLIRKTAPAEILTQKPLRLPKALSEPECLSHLKKYADQNHIFKNHIGMGYYETELPPVIQRNILENPVWLSPYTPYQSEISQGRLQALLNFQTMIKELTEMDMAGASLLDEGTATAEAVSMAFNNRHKAHAKAVFIDENMFPQTQAVLKTRASGLETIIGPAKSFDFNQKFFCAVIQYPDSKGEIYDWEFFCKTAKEKNILTIFTADLLSLCLFKTPGAMGADIVTGACQRMGLPLFFGGPHPAYIATRKKYVRSLPGRIVGLSRDRHKDPALRLSLQTREQHIRREKATSNICTAQALPAVLCGMYALYHGPKRLKNIALGIHLLAQSLFKSLKDMGFKVRKNKAFFDTVQMECKEEQGRAVYESLIQNKINIALFRSKPSHPVVLSFSINETDTKEDIKNIISAVGKALHRQKTNFNELANYEKAKQEWDKRQTKPDFYKLIRKTPCLKHPVFNKFHSETRLLRYIHYLQKKDLSLAHSMIPLGSCTMKLNGTTELMPVTWPGFSRIHPFAPLEQTKGWQNLIQDLGHALCEITGFAGISFQPNAGSQGEYTGLLIIRKWHEENKNFKRKICLIPSSAHGTNPASAVMAGLRPVTIACDKEGCISREDLQKKIKLYKNELAGLMLTYPSTFGLFEKGIPEICEWIHSAGGLVYLDGANMNALTGISKPAEWGADLCHLNLHKTFCVPHGGGGPGAGPVAVTKALKKFLPSHPFFCEKAGVSAVSSAPYGNAGVLIISYGYIRLMGAEGLKQATQTAVLNAHYIAEQLKDHYKILHTGKNNKIAHECILDFRKFKHRAEIDVNDVAKRLADYGFHAPTVSWPVPGALMVEPTESEDKQELDRFCSALIQIRKEIKEIEDKKYDTKNNVLKNAPHTLKDALKEKWPFPYSKQKAFYPLSWVKEHKFWPPVSRVEEAYGDINLFCSCPPLEKDYEVFKK